MCTGTHDAKPGATWPPRQYAEHGPQRLSDDLGHGVSTRPTAQRDHNGTRGAALTVQPNAAIIFRTQHASAPVVWP